MVITAADRGGCSHIPGEQDLQSSWRQAQRKVSGSCQVERERKVLIGRLVWLCLWVVLRDKTELLSVCSPRKFLIFLGNSHLTNSLVFFLRGVE